VTATKIISHKFYRLTRFEGLAPSCLAPRMLGTCSWLLAAVAEPLHVVSQLMFAVCHIAVVGGA